MREGLINELQSVLSLHWSEDNNHEFQRIETWRSSFEIKFSRREIMPRNDSYLHSFEDKRLTNEY